MKKTISELYKNLVQFYRANGYDSSKINKAIQVSNNISDISLKNKVLGDNELKARHFAAEK